MNAANRSTDRIGVITPAPVVDSEKDRDSTTATFPVVDLTPHKQAPSPDTMPMQGVKTSTYDEYAYSPSQGGRRALASQNKTRDKRNQ